MINGGDGKNGKIGILRLVEILQLRNQVQEMSCLSLMRGRIKAQRSGWARGVFDCQSENRTSKNGNFQMRNYLQNVFLNQINIIEQKAGFQLEKYFVANKRMTSSLSNFLFCFSQISSQKPAAREAFRFLLLVTRCYNFLFFLRSNRRRELGIPVD